MVSMFHAGSIWNGTVQLETTVVRTCWGGRVVAFLDLAAQTSLPCSANAEAAAANPDQEWAADDRRGRDALFGPRHSSGIVMTLGFWSGFVSQPIVSSCRLFLRSRRGLENACGQPCGRSSVGRAGTHSAPRRYSWRRTSGLRSALLGFGVSRFGLIRCAGTRPDGAHS